ncbi:protein-tyrosine-phosphatase [Litorimonas cladophorae]|uniref:Protein-tyrosine-phosphatase n=1 Tax=Litorimonas cladophorae TaxID=1220491 RepID=A0A918KQF2_9PROT|nr:tyrosine-protein phosphatase [Litorimonas cladophorae]GGX71893.1 protein-tyrosine-phosphatase [Litorimonas cladophorae]
MTDLSDQPLDLNNPRDRKQARRDLVWGDHGFLRTRFPNRHDLGGGMCRENQPSPERIALLAEEGIKTILNLRGPSPKGFYWLEKEACEKHGIALINFRVYSRDVHTVEKIRDARDLFEKIEYPAMMHCKSGADRTGFMGVLYRHFHMGDTIAQAVDSELTLKKLHVKQGKTGMLDFFFNDYLKYAEDHDITFMDWVETIYDPADVKARFMDHWTGNPISELLRRE